MTMDTRDDRCTVTEESAASREAKRLVSRRQFLKLSGVSIIAASALGPVLARSATKPLIIIEQARGIVIADATKCVGCRRCELACTEFNDGKAAPSMARIRVNRNLNFGSRGIQMGQNGQGNWGNGLIVQDLCKQCPDPVPCANVCPKDAIFAKPPLNARVVDAEKCTGCRMCQRACPWEMMSFDEDRQKATKCFLCDGKPRCVEACPAEALVYASWSDLTRATPPRVAPTAVIPAAKAAARNDCRKK